MTRKYQGLNRVTLGLVEVGVTAGTLYSRYRLPAAREAVLEPWPITATISLLVPICSATFSYFRNPLPGLFGDFLGLFGVTPIVERLKNEWMAVDTAFSVDFVGQQLRAAQHGDAGRRIGSAEGIGDGDPDREL